MTMNAPDKPPKGVQLTPEQLRKRRARNVALGVAIGLVVVLFYMITVVKLGPGVLKGGM